VTNQSGARPDLMTARRLPKRPNQRSTRSHDYPKVIKETKPAINPASRLPEGIRLNQLDLRPNLSDHPKVSDKVSSTSDPTPTTTRRFPIRLDRSSTREDCTGTDRFQSMKTEPDAPREMQQKNWGSSTSGVYSPRESVPSTMPVRANQRSMLSWASASSGISPPLPCDHLHERSPHELCRQPSPKAVLVVAPQGFPTTG
jgi:hypothetical protein